ncbi:MAG: L-glutamate gamma-semialdehyde dehydrogenase [Firmicutes bacterium]|nr:L-glutamate gamma-semialdehyde dehydrogenase [Bacillota bacterium]
MAVEPYRHEPVLTFSRVEEQAAMRDALARVRTRLGRRYPLIIGGQPRDSGESIVSVNPSRPEEVIGTVARAAPGLIDEALDAAWSAFADWSRTPAAERARVLFKAAAIMRARRLELDAWEVLEAGKSWVEADADVAEAIDFLEYYGRQMIRLAEPVVLTPLPGEDDEAFYIPLGVGAIIPPWNFPLAILTGMSAAAIVAGNTILLKPASATPVLGAQFAAVMEEAGLPPGVLNFVPGEGAVVGDYLVGHPRTRFISFTGSREVGLRINRLAAETPPGQRWIKRVVAELGGKDAIVVDETADLEAAARGIVVSAFGFQGQKCSACSRVIAVDAVYDDLLARVREMTEALTIGPAEDPAYFMGPVIDEQAVNKILGYIEWGKAHARLITGGERLPGPGYFIAPTIFADVVPGSKLEQEEVFGPVVAFIRARDWAEALAIANDTVYGLTGSVYTRRRDRIQEARQVFHVGNLYINRKCTGAVVGAHPFGGFNLSGTDSKTGSPDYLLWFLQMKAVGEAL